MIITQISIISEVSIYSEEMDRRLIVETFNTFIIFIFQLCLAYNCKIGKLAVKLNGICIFA